MAPLAALVRFSQCSSVIKGDSYAKSGSTDDFSGSDRRRRSPAPAGAASHSQPRACCRRRLRFGDRNCREGFSTRRRFGRRRCRWPANLGRASQRRSNANSARGLQRCRGEKFAATSCQRRIRPMEYLARTGRRKFRPYDCGLGQGLSDLGRSDLRRRCWRPNLGGLAACGQCDLGERCRSAICCLMPSYLRFSVSGDRLPQIAVAAAAPATLAHMRNPTKSDGVKDGQRAIADLDQSAATKFGQHFADMHRR